MMGLQATKREYIVFVSLDEYVPEDHLLRAVDHHLDLSEFCQHVAGTNSHSGRPSIDPELMVRMLIIGYCYGIRSERRLCEEVSVNLSYRWFCRPGLKDKVPDHSGFSKNRHRRFRDSANTYVTSTSRSRLHPVTSMRQCKIRSPASFSTQ